MDGEAGIHALVHGDGHHVVEPQGCGGGAVPPPGAYEAGTGKSPLFHVIRLPSRSRSPRVPSELGGASTGSPGVRVSASDPKFAPQ